MKKRGQLFQASFKDSSSKHNNAGKSRMKVFVTRKFPGPGLDFLKRYYEVRVYPKDQVIPRKELLKGVRWCDALLCFLTDKIDKEVIDACPDLKIISIYAVGYNNIDVKYATSKCIPVCNTPSQAVVDAVAEHTFALLLGVAKRIHEADEKVREGKWKGWEPEFLLGTLIKGKTLGIIGLGRIGAGVAERAAHGMKMKVLYHDIIRNKDFEKKYKAQFVPIKKLLQQSDFITLHVPLLPETRHLISTKELSQMKKTAYLINTSRGPVIDEEALIKALQKKIIAGAGLDVFEKDSEVDKHLIKMDNVILTPHIASATVEVRIQMSKDAAENVHLVLRGKKAAKTVNQEVYKTG